MGGVAKAAKKVATVVNPVTYLANAGLYKGVKKGGEALGLWNPKGEGNPGVPGPFSIDPNQMAGDQTAINELGEKQYGETLTGIDEVGKGAQKYASETIDRMLPGIYEDMNARNLFQSSATGQEVGKQASYLAQDVARDQAEKRLAALTGRQGFQTSALQRGLSLEDFINQANVAKTIGAQMAPQVPSGKGTTVSGIGAGAAAGAPFGPWGSAIGGASGALLASNRKGK